MMGDKPGSTGACFRLALGATGCALLICWCSHGVEAPTMMTGTPIDDTTVMLGWLGNSDDEDGFRIYRDEGSGFVELTTTPADWAGCADDTVTAGQFYTYYVVAYIGGVESAHSNEVTVEAGTPYVDIPTPPDGAELASGDMYDITWTTNMPDFDGRFFLSTDGGVGWPPQHVIQTSWTDGSPWTWKVGYKNSEEDPSKPPVWEQAVTSTCTQCKILIMHYSAVGAQGWSEGTFTITVPDSGDDSNCGSGTGIWAVVLILLGLGRRRRKD